ncbi:hypothetical protein QWY75_00675 [Pontixanthobacter aestiaquae]|uniref:Uncharacterized protein n=1 Tax=Pontixanthobacter aestiaquae TaxID=1509367 RepID=A0A844Z6L8_9SPHN|nr:hypothetical protein [Pontixanthobacter aestiaquae]MDN3644712.1 hypothetical protein [Pontixanthobacter aestiaquae]MXO84281.1 hypothetical protein [Pontixanthobacter aestiaquae]
MNRLIHMMQLSALLALAVSTPSFAAGPDGVPEGASAEQIAANETAARIGEQMYQHDRAAWRASDELNAQLRPEDRPDYLTYITEELDNGNIRVVFYTKLEEALVEFVVFEIDRGNVVSAKMHDDPSQHPLSDLLLKKVAARDVAMQQGAEQKLPLCRSGAANYVTLPPDDEGMIAVYILSPPVIPGRFPLGGHYRFMIDAEGEAVSGRAFENSCLDAPRFERYVHNAPENFPFVHVLDPHPTEIHHFAARYMNLALQVTAAEVTWNIDYVRWTDEEIAAGEAMANGVMPGSQ